MIRPLEYCATSSHLEASMQTIDIRIEELLRLRDQYLEKYNELRANGGTVVPATSAQGLHEQAHVAGRKQVTKPINK